MNSKLRIKAVLLAAAVMLSALCSCSMKLSVDEPEEAAEEEAVSQPDESCLMSGTTVSIIQYIDYSSLNECCEGVKKALDAAGVGYEVTVGQEPDAAEECGQKARDIVTNGSCDLVIAIGTPCAESVFPIISSAAGVPVVFCAVTDPVGAGLVQSAAEPGVNCTGVATAFNINEQLNMINTFQPSITRLGVIYTSSEQNAQVQLKGLRKASEKLGITVFAEPVDSPAEMSEKAQELMGKVEAVVILPDNMTSKNSWNITSRTIAGEMPLYGVNLTQVKEGALAGYCYDFEALGEKAGRQAAEILHGESAADTPVIMENECKLYVNKDRLKDLNMTIPDEYKASAAEVTTSYEK